MVYKKSTHYFLTFVIIYFIFTPLYSMVVGTQIAPSRQTLQTFPSADTNNLINTFAWMDGGFTLQSNTTTCTFTSVLPVSGPITLNGGSLYLMQDLVLTNHNINWVTGGQIWGNGYAFVLPKYPGIFQMPTGATALQLRNTNLVMNSDLQFNQNVNFIGSCRVNGNGYVLTIPSSVTLAVNDQSFVTFENVTLNIQGISSLACLSNNTLVTLRNCTLLLSSNFNFSAGVISIQNNVIFRGPYIFAYTSGVGSSIESQSLLFLDYDLTFSYAPIMSSQDLFSFSDESSSLYLNGCTLYSTITGLRLDTGTVFIDNNVTMTSEGRNSGEAAQIGADLNCVILSEGYLNLFGQFKYV